jgi:hypothetical protein
VASDSTQKRRVAAAEQRGRECEDSLLERVVAAEERRLSSLIASTGVCAAHMSKSTAIYSPTG